MCLPLSNWGLTAERRSADEQLAERLCKKDAQALADLYDQYARAAYSTAVRIVRDSAVAEDVVQETFFQIWTKAGSYDPRRGTIGVWVVRLARNRAIDYLRSAAGRMAARAVQLSGAEASADGADPDSQLEDRRRIDAALRKLNPHQLVVIQLAYYEGMSQSEMAGHLNQPLGTIKTAVRAALRILRQEFAQPAPKQLLQPCQR